MSTVLDTFHILMWCRLCFCSSNTTSLPPSVSNVHLFISFPHHHLSICLLWLYYAIKGVSFSLSGSVLSGEGVHGLQEVQGQAVLGVVLWQDFNQTADQPAGLGQGDQGAPQLTGVLQYKKHIMCIVIQAARSFSATLHGFQLKYDYFYWMKKAFCIGLSLNKGILSVTTTVLNEPDMCFASFLPLY